MTVLTGSFCWALGILAALSFNIWADVRPAAFLPFLADKNFFALFDYIVANLLLPLNALLIAVFAGWLMPWQAVIDELDLKDARLRQALHIILKFVAPVLIGTIFYQSLTS